ncbi:MAG: hypothetical protein ACE5E9_11785 [Nitrospinaceae bacterium]
MDKLEAVQRVLRFSDRVRDWVTREYSVYFDDFDEQNVRDYGEGGFGGLADDIIKEGIKDNLLEDEDIE